MKITRDGDFGGKDHIEVVEPIQLPAHCGFCGSKFAKSSEIRYHTTSQDSSFIGSDQSVLIDTRPEATLCSGCSEKLQRYGVQTTEYTWARQMWLGLDESTDELV